MYNVNRNDYDLKLMAIVRIEDVTGFEKKGIYTHNAGDGCCECVSLRISGSRE